MTIDEPKAPRIEDDALIIETQTTTEVYDAKYLVSALLVFVGKSLSYGLHQVDEQHDRHNRDDDHKRYGVNGSRQSRCESDKQRGR